MRQTRSAINSVLELSTKLSASAVQRKLDELDEAVLEDQRVVRAFEAWRACVRDETGQTFEDSEDVELRI